MKEAQEHFNRCAEILTRTNANPVLRMYFDLDDALRCKHCKCELQSLRVRVSKRKKKKSKFIKSFCRRCGGKLDRSTLPERKTTKKAPPEPEVTKAKAKKKKRKGRDVHEGLIVPKEFAAKRMKKNNFDKTKISAHLNSNYESKDKFAAFLQ